MSTVMRHKLRRSLSKLKQQAHFARLALSGQPVYTCEVDLENVLIGEQCATPLEKWVEKTGEWNRVSCSLRDSPYVHFLRSISENESRLLDDDYLETMPYYRMAQVAVDFTGGYFGMNSPQGIKRQMRTFYNFFMNTRDGCHRTDSPVDYRHSASGDPLQMTKIKDSNCYELGDGHHRTSALYVLGKRRVTAQILGEKTTYLQRLLRQRYSTDSFQLDQPIETLDVRSWPVQRDCQQHLELILAFLSARGLRHSIRTVLDMPCKYGWFVNQLRKAGFEAKGITPRPIDVKIARAAYGLPDDAICLNETTDFLRKSNKKYDVVLSLDTLHQFGVGEQQVDGDQILKLLDHITGSILILDCGNSDKEWSQSNFPEGDETHFRTLIRRHSSFKQIIPLSRDHCSRSNSEIQTGRKLFACIR